MQSADDNVLLREYATNQSGEAFAALVARHVNLVYSVALRQTGNPHHAEEITQAVFIILARKAAALRHDRAVSSWLFQATRLTANNFIRSEIRRHHREQEAYMQSIFNETGEHTWQKIAPLLDAAVAGLNEQDRRAILLRFYEGRNLREVGTALGASEEAAKKRVTRALEKMQSYFLRRGISSTTAILAGAISANSVQAAPALLTKTVTAAALAKGATASVSTLTLTKGALKVMAWSKAKTAIVVGIAAVAVLGTAGKLASQHWHQSVILPDATVQRLRSATLQDYFPRSSWVFAGYDDPKSTVMTSLWAVREGDSEKIMDCLAPEAQKKVEQELAVKEQAEGKSMSQLLVQQSAEKFSHNTGFRVLNTTTISNDVVAVHLIVPEDFRVEYAFLLKKIGSEWKIEDFRN